MAQSSKNFIHIFNLFSCIESESEVAQSCPTLCDPMDCSLPCSSVHGIFKARVLKWVAISFSRGSSWPRNQSQVSSLWILYQLNYQGCQPFKTSGYLHFHLRSLTHSSAFQMATTVSASNPNWKYPGTALFNRTFCNDGNTLSTLSHMATTSPSEHWVHDM